MSTNAAAQKLPAAGPAREALRVKGQFWTPDWVAEAMVAYLLAGDPRVVFDPAVGAGAFFRAAKRVAQDLGRSIRLQGTELDPQVLQQARDLGLSSEDLADVGLRDFVLQPPPGPIPSIVANPPYIRHHRLSDDTKAHLKTLSLLLIGTALDARAGYHIYFLLRGLQLLEKGGRLAFIMPADTVEGKSAPTLWTWITTHYRLDAVITFTPEAAPFPGVDTNALVFLIRNLAPTPSFSWVQCKRAQTGDLKQWVLSDLADAPGEDLVVIQRDVKEGVETGLSRPPVAEAFSGLTLGRVAKVLRGIASGSNDFFFLTAKRAEELRIPAELLVPMIGRMRDVRGDTITAADYESTRRQGQANPPVLA